MQNTAPKNCLFLSGLSLEIPEIFGKSCLLVTVEENYTFFLMEQPIYYSGNVINMYRFNTDFNAYLTRAFTFQFDFNGLLNNPEFSALINTLLDDLFCSFLNEHRKLISEIISPILEFIINKILAGPPTEYLQDLYREQAGKEMENISLEEWFGYISN